MYAIVKTGGKQYRVERGQRLLIERLPEAEGANVALQPILYRSEETVFDKAGLEKVKVTAKIIANVRGEKLRVFKFKPKRGYKRRTGHRQDLTRIEVTDISIGGAAKASAKPAAATHKSEDGEAVKAAAVKSAAVKPAAVKPAAVKSAAAKPIAAESAAAKPAAVKPAAANPTAAKKETEDGS
jgi:large subunit ribosomal protein L21